MLLQAAVVSDDTGYILPDGTNPALEDYPLMLTQVLGVVEDMINNVFSRPFAYLSRVRAEFAAFYS